MTIDTKQTVYQWITAESKNVNVVNDYYCQTRDVFEIKNNKTLNELIKYGISENKTYLISAIIGEIGNNSFDHNLGNWPDVMGIFFSHKIKDQVLEIILADRGQGILKTLKKAKPELKNDSEALLIAFTEKISGRALENRGNGLKFVKNIVKEIKANLFFASGNGQAELNHQLEIKQTSQNIKGCLAILKIDI
jgi:sensor histidine kinase regulating citrate/malate metabolism